MLSCTVAVVVACSGSSNTLDGNEIERSIVTQLRKDFTGAPVGKAHCPNEIKRKTGNVFTCSASVGNEPVPITVTQT